MKVKSTLTLVLTLMVMMLAAGGTSASIGYLMGQEALKAVTQPEVNTDKKLKNKPLTGPYKGLELVDEKKVLVEVYNLTNAQENEGTIQQKSQLPQSSEDKVRDVSFPLRDQSEGVTLEVLKAQQEGNSLLIDLSLKNDGQKSVRFLYSFLDVRDEQGRVLSAIPEGLPGELPANGQNFTGKLKIPLALLDSTKNISLTLTDYPEQKLELKLKEIPVTR